MDKRRILQAAIAAAALAAGTPGFAQRFAQPQPIVSGSVTLVGYTLTDLAPGDGIAPSVTFTRQPLAGGSSLQTRDASNSPQVVARGEFDADGDAVATLPGARAGAHVAGHTAATDIVLDAPLYAVARAGVVDEFVLSPYTRMTLTFAAQFANTPGATPAGQALTGTVWVDASAHLDRDANGLPVYRSFMWNPGFTDQLPPAVVTADLESSAAATGGYVWLESYAVAGPVAAPVPEPRAWAMLALGLVCVAAAGRYTRARANDTLPRPPSLD